LEQRQRNRARKLISKLNKERKSQNKKIDILCNNLILTQKKIVEQLQEYNFTLEFCQSIAGQTDLGRLMRQSQELIQMYFANCGIGLFLLESKGFAFHSADGECGTNLDINKVESFFNDDVVNYVCNSNSVCSLNDMSAAGLDSDISELNKLSIFAIPLSGFGKSVGFIMIWRKMGNPIKKTEIERLCSVSPILAKAVRGCLAISKQLNGVI
jgi:hypothetical protein